MRPARRWAESTPLAHALCQHLHAVGAGEQHCPPAVPESGGVWHVGRRCSHSVFASYSHTGLYSFAGTSTAKR